MKGESQQAWPFPIELRWVLRQALLSGIHACLDVLPLRGKPVAFRSDSNPALAVGSYQPNG
jgi:hypothetical protein